MAVTKISVSSLFSSYCKQTFRQTMYLIWCGLFISIVNRDKLVKHHSGQYRHKTASVWDPHPEYEFTAFGQLFHLVLAHDSKFISPDIKVSGNKTKYLFIAFCIFTIVITENKLHFTEIVC